MRKWVGVLGVCSLLTFLLGIAPAAADPWVAGVPTVTPPRLLQTIKVPGTAGRWDIVAVDPANGMLYLSASSNASLDVMDLATGTFVAEIGGLPVKKSASGSYSGSNGLAVATDRDEVFVSDQIDNALHVYDTKTNTQTAVIPTTQEGSDSVAYDPVDHKVFVTNGDSKTVTVIDATTNAVIDQIAVPGSPELSAWDPFNDTILQNLSSQNQQAVIDAKTDKVLYVFNLPPGCNPHGVALNPADQHEVLGCSKQMTVLMDAGDGSILSVTRHVGGSDATAYDPVDGRFYTASSSYKPGPVLGALDATTDDWVANAATDKGAHSLDVDPKTGDIYVAAQTPGTILVFAPASKAR